MVARNSGFEPGVGINRNSTDDDDDDDDDDDGSGSGIGGPMIIPLFRCCVSSCVYNTVCTMNTASESLGQNRVWLLLLLFNPLQHKDSLFVLEQQTALALAYNDVIPFKQ
jgi:hypothetical protein